MGLLKAKHGLEKVQKNVEVSKGESLQWQQTQMGVIITSKTRATFDKLSALTTHRDKLLKDIDQKNAAIEEVKATVRHGEDFKQYVDMLRSKSATYKKMKKEIDERASEYGVLLRTQQLLEQQTALASEFVTQEGMTPAGDPSDHTQKKISAKNLKKLIVEVSLLVNEKRCKLTPQVKELQLLRVALQELELEHAEKKQQHSDICSLFERKVTKLEADISASSKEFELKTETLKENASEMERLQDCLIQLHVEEENGAVSEKLSSQIDQQEEVMTGLSQKQQKLKEIEHSNLEQMTMMKDLLTLLAAKVALYSSGSKPAIFSTATSLETGEGTH